MPSYLPRENCPFVPLFLQPSTHNRLADLHVNPSTLQLAQQCDLSGSCTYHSTFVHPSQTLADYTARHSEGPFPAADKPNSTSLWPKRSSVQASTSGSSRMDTQLAVKEPRFRSSP